MSPVEESAGSIGAELAGSTDATPGQRGVSRRNMLRFGIAGGAAVALPGAISRLRGHGASAAGHVAEQGTVAGVISDKAPMTGPTLTKFAQELKIPPVLTPTSTTTKTILGEPTQVRHYALNQRPQLTQLLPTKDANGRTLPQTEIWGYNGIYPGPTIRQMGGGPITHVRNTNSLPGGRAYSTHLHGSPTQPGHDGHPDDQTYPTGFANPPASKFWKDGRSAYVGTRDYWYPNHEETRTLWYHDHNMHTTAENAYKGLVAMFIQDANATERAKFNLDALPTGRYDVPLIVADMQFTADGKVAFDDKGHDSLWGNVLFVNGTAWPKMTVDQGKYRFRFLVADLSRGYNFKLSNGMPFTMIGTDAGLLREPVQVQEFRQGMAERYEVIIDFAGRKAGEKITLLNTAGDGDMGQVMQFVVGTNAGHTAAVPSQLNDYTFGQDNTNLAATRNFRFERSNGLWVINGLPWDGRVAANPRIGTNEKWVFENKSGGWFHPVHVHLVDFHIVSRNGGAPRPYERGWKDVAYVGPNERLELTMRFHESKQIDPKMPTLGNYVMHCHNLIHEDHDMMTQFGVQGGTTASQALAHGGEPQKSMMVQWTLDSA